MLIATTVSALTPQEGTLPPEQEARYRTLIHELRCLVCQNQTIADSNADLANDLRKQVHDRIASGESDADIRRYVTDRYGDFVLYKPLLSARTVLLWAGPFLILAGALVIALRILRRRPKAGLPSQAADPARLRKLLDEEKL
ncbi:MAG: cytochrome c-type biogenesis protein [Panacagrimonas sp.]